MNVLIVINERKMSKDSSTSVLCFCILPIRNNKRNLLLRIIWKKFLTGNISYPNAHVHVKI